MFISGAPRYSSIDTLHQSKLDNKKNINWKDLDSNLCEIIQKIDERYYKELKNKYNLPVDLIL